MVGNLPHNGPGGDERCVVFWSAKPRNLECRSIYNGRQQMTKEKLLLKMIREIREDAAVRKDTPNDCVIDFLYKCFVKSVRDTVMNGAFDGTLERDQPSEFDFENDSWFVRFNQYLLSIDNFKNNRTAQNESDMERDGESLAGYWRDVEANRWGKDDPFRRAYTASEQKKVNQKIKKKLAAVRKKEAEKEAAKKKKELDDASEFAAKAREALAHNKNLAQEEPKDYPPGTLRLARADQTAYTPPHLQGHQLLEETSSGQGITR